MPRHERARVLAGARAHGFKVETRTRAAQSDWMVPHDAWGILHPCERCDRDVRAKHTGRRRPSNNNASSYRHDTAPCCQHTFQTSPSPPLPRFQPHWRHPASALETSAGRISRSRLICVSTCRRPGAWLLRSGDSTGAGMTAAQRAFDEGLKQPVAGVTCRLTGGQPPCGKQRRSTWPDVFGRAPPRGNAGLHVSA
jgi:hypothetical protein